MKEKLFVYGTLGPGRPNEHIMKNIGGDWHEGHVYGTLIEAGWGADLGYPGISLNRHGDKISGFIFSSDNLHNHWQMLDEFEGEGYRRVETDATLIDGTVVKAYIYALREAQ